MKDILLRMCCPILLLVVSTSVVWAADDSNETAEEPSVTSPSDSFLPSEEDNLGASGATDKPFNAAQLIANITIFVLAVFVGFEMITRVPPTLHTPLMSGSNAISGITLVGALLATGSGNSYFAAFLGLVAVILATVNAVGGFLVTDRMLSMFRRG